MDFDILETLKSIAVKSQCELSQFPFHLSSSKMYGLELRKFIVTSIIIKTEYIELGKKHSKHYYLLGVRKNGFRYEMIFINLIGGRVLSVYM